MKTANLEQAVYRRSDVAAATAIPEATLNRWQERGLIQATIPAAGTGHHRLYSALDIARLAAISELTKFIPVGDAVEVIDRSISGGFAYLRALIERGEDHIFVCIAQRDGDRLISEISPYSNQVAIFFCEPTEGCQVDDPDDRPKNPRLVHRCVFDIGPAITAALLKCSDSRVTHWK